MRSEYEELWDALRRSSRNRETPIRENLEAVLTAAAMPEKFWDADLRQLLDIGAIPILRRMLTERPVRIKIDHEFLRAFARCPNIE